MKIAIQKQILETMSDTHFIQYTTVHVSILNKKHNLAGIGQIRMADVLEGRIGCFGWRA